MLLSSLSNFDAPLISVIITNNTNIILSKNICPELLAKSKEVPLVTVSPGNNCFPLLLSKVVERGGSVVVL